MNLTGKRIVITRPRAHAEKFAGALSAAGAQPVFFPVIEILPSESYSVLDFALQSLDQYDWIVFTSVHGVGAFFKRIEVLGILRIPTHVRVAGVGPGTARCLSEHSIWVDHIPGEYAAEAMLPGFGYDIHGKRFLFPQSNLARTSLADAIRSAGGLVTEAVVYRNVVHEPDAAELNDLRVGADIVTFTSPSTVRGFVDIVRRSGLDVMNLPGNPLFACIGPVTKQAAEEAGLSNIVVAAEYTTDGLIEALSHLIQT